MTASKEESAKLLRSQSKTSKEISSALSVSLSMVARTLGRGADTEVPQDSQAMMRTIGEFETGGRQQDACTSRIIFGAAGQGLLGMDVRGKHECDG